MPNYYRKELLECINSVIPSVYTSYCTKAQSIDLKSLGVTCYSTYNYCDVYVHIAVPVGSIPDDERSLYFIRQTIDDDGYPIEVLVEDTKHFESENEFSNFTRDAECFVFEFIKKPENKDKRTITEIIKYPRYSEHELESMLIRSGKLDKQPYLDGDRWAVKFDSGYGNIVIKTFKNRAEALAKVLIDIINAAPYEPKPVKIEFNGAKADYTSPAYLARQARLDEQLKELQSHAIIDPDRMKVKTSRPR